MVKREFSFLAWLLLNKIVARNNQNFDGLNIIYDKEIMIYYSL